MKTSFLKGLLTLSLFSATSFAKPPAVDGLVYLEHTSFCSGSLFAPEGYDKNHKALVLTNGHCTDQGSASFFGMSFPSTVEKIINAAADNVSILVLKKGAEDVMENAGYLNDNGDSKLLFATMYKKDVAIYQVNHTYAELEQQGFRPLILAKKSPARSSIITFHSSAWGTEVACTFDGIADTLIEGQWVWKNMLRMAGEGCGAQGGASGSPVLDSEGRIVAVLNTVFEGGKKCTIMNPCERERDSGQSIGVSGAIYSVPVVDLNLCFDQNKNFDLSQSQCALAN